MAKVSKWGNSLAVRLPKKVVDALELKDGDEIHLGVQEGSPPAFEVSRDDREERVKKALAELRTMRGLLPERIEFDREELYRRG